MLSSGLLRAGEPEEQAHTGQDQRDHVDRARVQEQHGRALGDPPRGRAPLDHQPCADRHAARAPQRHRRPECLLAERHSRPERGAAPARTPAGTPPRSSRTKAASSTTATTTHCAFMCETVVATPLSPGTASSSPTTSAPASTSVMNPLRRLRRAFEAFTCSSSYGCPGSRLKRCGQSGVREVSDSLGRLWLQHRIEVLEHSELAQDHGSRRIAVEHLEAAVLELEDIAAGRVHPVPRRRKNPLR